MPSQERAERSGAVPAGTMGAALMEGSAGAGIIAAGAIWFLLVRR
jgi:hypothetical protein